MIESLFNTTYDIVTVSTASDSSGGRTETLSIGSSVKGLIVPVSAFEAARFSKTTAEITDRLYCGSGTSIDFNSRVTAYGEDNFTEDFAADTGWTKGAGWTIAGGVAVGAATMANLTKTVAPLTVGSTYQVVFTVSGYSDGSVKVYCGTTGGTLRIANGTYNEILVCAGSGAFYMDGATTFTGDIDDISVVEIPAEVYEVIDIRDGALGANAHKEIDLKRIITI